MHYNTLISLRFFIITLTLAVLWTAGCDDGQDSNGTQLLCGDGKVNSSEECDSGNLMGHTCKDFGYGGGFLKCTDQCTFDFSTCIPKSCGDGRVDSGEECDDGNANSDDTPNACRTNCRLPYCGDGVLDDGEECDDGTANSDQPDAACRTDCTPQKCGDGIVDTGEQCDNGASNSDSPNASCRTNCTQQRCGDGILDTLLGEVCDDGNNTDGDGCSADCASTEVCGNKIVDSEEECDEGASNSNAPNSCRTNCTLPYCGDGITDDLMSEQCDDGSANSDSPNATCRTDCQLPRCGDGIIDDLMGEQCDDGTANSDQPDAACRTDCTPRRCGDGIVDSGEVCDDGNSDIWDGCDSCIRITEFCVPGNTGGNQAYAMAAMAPDGHFVVLWSDNQGLDGDGWGIFARRYGPAGTPDGTQFQVNSTTEGDQALPRAAMGPDGRLAVIWMSEDQEGDWDILAQRFDASGTPDGTEFCVTSTTDGYQGDPWITIGQDGHFVVVWMTDLEDGNEFEIMARIFDASGTPDGTEIRVNTYSNGNQLAPRAAMASDGRFVVVWQSASQDGDRFGIFARLFDASGNPEGPEFQVNSWTSEDQKYPSVAMTPDGRFVVVWQSNGQDGDGSGIFARLFDASGTPQSSDIRVNSHTPRDQSHPSVAMAPDGRFVVVWQSLLQDGSYLGVYGQRYDASGTPDGTEFQVNVYTDDLQEDPSVAMASDGRFVVAWQSTGQDGDYEGIFAQKYTPDGTPLGSLPWP